MNEIELLTPVLDDGIQNTHFFNGRLLTAQDLQDEQKANREQHWRLGQAIGAGVVHGLQVSLGTDDAQPTVRVTPGLALNREGQALYLSEEVAVILVPVEEETPKEAGLFVTCSPPKTDQIYTGAGVYILAVAPASGFSAERALKHGLHDDGRASECGFRYALEGVQFELIHVNVNSSSIVGEGVTAEFLSLMGASDTDDISRLRNLLAHLCFGAAEGTHLAGDPFAKLDRVPRYAASGILDNLRTLGVLSSCDVPLALLYWDTQGPRFVDNWTVRRLVRGGIDLAVPPALHGAGLERFYQFQEHIQSLADTLTNLASRQIQQYFRFLPAVAYFPVTGVDSPRGFHPDNFIGQFTTATPGSIRAGDVAELLFRSFSLPAIDLHTKPVVQTYAVKENQSAVAAGDSSQLYQVFISRSLHGPLAQDGVAKAMQDAWQVYRGLIKRRVFLPPGTDQEKIAAQIAIISAIRDVLHIANRLAALSKNWALDAQAALDAFQEMYHIQKELATLFQSDIPGVIHTQSRELFGQTLDNHLEGTGDIPGLLPAVQAGDLIAAVEAQNRINHFVGTWSGEGVAVGPFGFFYDQSPRGIQLVPGHPEPYPHHFTVSNGTDKDVTMELEAVASAPTGDWSESVSIRRFATGSEIDSITLQSGTAGTIIVLVSAPEDAAIGETVTLTLTATIPPPTGRTSPFTFDELVVAEESGEPVLRSVDFVFPAQTPSALDPTDAPPNNVLSYIFNFTYAAPKGPPTANFVFTVTRTPADADEWPVGFQGVEAGTPEPGVFTREVVLSTESSPQVEVMILTPSRQVTDNSASFVMSIASTDLDPAIADEYPEPFELTVRAA